MKILLAILTAPIYLDIMCHMVQFSFRLFCYGPSSARNYPNYRSLFEIFTRLWHRLNRCRERHKRRNSMKNVTIYTDGACSGNPGPGGWGAVLRYRFNGKVYEKELSGGDASTTNNRMELTAFIEALRQLKEPCEVRLCSDSQYVINGLEKGWARGWKRRGWKKSDGSPALNPDLWEQALEQEARHKLTYVWVKGHAGHPENERCDQLAVAQSQAHGGRQGR